MLPLDGSAPAGFAAAGVFSGLVWMGVFLPCSGS